MNLSDAITIKTNFIRLKPRDNTKKEILISKRPN